LSATRPVWLSRKEVERFLDLTVLKERLRAAFLDIASGRAADPRPLRIDADDLAANYVGFPCHWPAVGLASVKVLSGAERNPEIGLPVIDAVIVVMDAATGRIRAIMDATAITTLRTAATTALAVDALRPPRRAVLGLIGTGAQMLAHARALAGGIEEILVASANNALERAALSARAIALETGLAPRACLRSDVASRSDILVTTSISHEPLIRSGETKADAVVISVGPFKPGATEIDPALVSNAAVVVSDRRDRLQDVWRGAAGALGPMFEGMNDLPALLAAPPERLRPGVRVFLSEGRSIEDLAAASIVLGAAQELGGCGLVLP
jgi:ornithine cyclodeaminase/alanine dehydrogenase-like protein (mu-crystallin family)